MNAPGEMHEWNEVARLRLPVIAGRQGWTWRELGLAADVDPSTLTGWHRGKNGMRARTLGKVCAVLGVDPADVTAPVRCQACTDVPREGWLCTACAPGEVRALLARTATGSAS